MEKHYLLDVLCLFSHSLRADLPFGSGYVNKATKKKNRNSLTFPVKSDYHDNIVNVCLAEEAVVCHT